jgi:large subunit ribosomal protein L21
LAIKDLKILPLNENIWRLKLTINRGFPYDFPTQYCRSLVHFGVYSLGGQKMYAIIETGGKQYRVEKGDLLNVELLETQEGGSIAFEQVLFLNNGALMKVGSPYLSQCKVLAELVREIKGPKEIAFKYKKRKGYRRKVGHRQRYCLVKITEIVE